MSIRQKRDDLFKKEKLEEDKRQKNLEKNIKKEWLEDFE